MVCSSHLPRILGICRFSSIILLALSLSISWAAAEATSQEKEKKLQARALLEGMDELALSSNPGMRSIVWLELANSYQAIDVSKVSGYLTNAFESSLAIANDENMKQRLQVQIVSRLLGFGQSEIEKLLPVANGTGRMFVLKALSAKCVADRRYDEALALLDEITAETEFPYTTATQIMLALPVSKTAEKQQLFIAALRNYQSRPHKQLTVGSDDLATMVVRFRNVMPRTILLASIDEILTQAKQSSPGSLDLSSNTGSASFNTNYEYRLFELLPVLRDLDPEQAKSLLQEQQNVNSLLHQYPDGLRSLDKTIRDSPLQKGEVPLLTITVHTKGSGTDGTDLVGQRLHPTVDALVSAAAEDPAKAIATALLLPVRVGAHYFRADALEGIARVTLTSSPIHSREALKDLKGSALEGIPPLDRADYLARTAQIELKEKEIDTAAGTIALGLQAADQLLSIDESEADPNQASKAYWPSVHVWQLFIGLADQVSHRFAQESLEKLHDPEIALLSRIALADAWLGVTPAISEVIEKHSSSEKYKGKTSPLDMVGKGPSMLTK